MKSFPIIPTAVLSILFFLLLPLSCLSYLKPLKQYSTGAPSHPSTTSLNQMPADALNTIPSNTITTPQLQSLYSDALSSLDPLSPTYNSIYTPSTSLLLQRLPSLPLSLTSISPSLLPSAGLGLFSKYSLPKSTLITLFPADCILLHPSPTSKITGYIGQNLTGIEERSYQVLGSDTYSIIGNSSLKSPAYSAHYANDYKILKSSREEYERESYLNSNSYFDWVFEGCCMGLYSRRRIERGEEIYVSYGEGYWRSRRFLNGGEEKGKGNKGFGK
jgi:hypothetical protein